MGSPKSAAVMQEEFAAVGRARIIELIRELEKAEPGWVQLLYITGTYEGDIAEAARLRRKFAMPKDSQND